jgi:hypothetical protein
MGMDVYGKAPSNTDGEYFRANIWSWRPIHILCETVLERDLPWSHNDGEGFGFQAACDVLADKLEEHMKTQPFDIFEVESDCRVSEDGHFIPYKRSDGPPPGRSAYSVEADHLRKFIKFLRSCGGFKIC